MTLYSITSPPYTYKEYIDHFVADKYDVHDWYLVNAKTKKDAAWAAYKRAIENHDGWSEYLEDKHPLAGVKVEDFSLEVPEPEWDEDLGRWITFTAEELGFNNLPSICGEKYYVDLLAEPELEFIL